MLQATKNLFDLSKQDLLKNLSTAVRGFYMVDGKIYGIPRGTDTAMGGIPVAIVPTIRLMMTLRVHNTYLGMILSYTAILLPFAVFLLTGYLRTIPRELDESARLVPILVLYYLLQRYIVEGMTAGALKG